MSFLPLLYSRVSGTTDRKNPWQPLVCGRQRWKGPVRFCLIPIRHGEKMVGAMIGVAVFNGGF